MRESRLRPAASGTGVPSKANPMGTAMATASTVELAPITEAARS